MLGENVALEVVPARSRLRVHADHNMLTQVLLNLAVNGRDAMSCGGLLTVRTSIEQNDEATAQRTPRVFEPFFTSKDVGKGTGLGLATVYGVMKQHRA